MPANSRALGAILLSGSLLLAACTRFIDAPPGPDATLLPQPTRVHPTLIPTSTIAPVVIPPEARRVTVSEIVNAVEARPSAEAAFAAVQDGTVIGAGGQVRTGPESGARVDLGDSAVVRLDGGTLFRIEALTDDGGSPLNLVGLDTGRIWVSLNRGSVQVLTPLGVATLHGPFAVFQFNPGDPGIPEDDTLQFDCLAGPCGMQLKGSDVAVGNGERVRAAGDSAEVSRQLLTNLDLLDFIAHNPGAIANSGATPAAAAETALPSAGTGTDAPTAQATPSGPTAVPVLGKHVVRPGESLFCIGRAYGVLPGAIAEASGLNINARLNPNTELIIPAVRWFNIPGGPVCAQQFNSPFPAGQLPPPTKPRPVFFPTPFSPDTATPEPPTPPPPPTLTPTPVCNPPEYYDPLMDRCRIQPP